MHSALKEAKSCEADETDSLRNKQGTEGVGVETEGWEKVEEAVETQARDIHIEYKNNRSLNTNNRKVLRVSTSFEKVERNKDRLLKGGFPGGGPLSGGPRHSPFGCGLDLTERESIGYPWPARAEERLPFLHSASRRVPREGWSGGPQNQTLRGSNQLLAGSCQDSALLCHKCNFQKLKRRRYRSVTWIP